MNLLFFIGEEEESESDEGDIEEVLSSDEDDVDEQGQEYLESLARKAIVAGGAQSLNITANITDADNDSEDEDSDYEPDEEMVLEAYTTPLDEDDCDIDEYIIFKETMQSMCILQFVVIYY